MTGPIRRVLMTTDTVGGVWVYSLELCASLARHNVHVTLMSMGCEPSPDQLTQAAQLDNVELAVTPYRTEWMAGCEDDLRRSGDALLRLAQAVRPDVVHLNGYWHASLPLNAPVLVVAHSCVASWWKNCRRGLLPHDWDLYRMWVSTAAEGADLLVAPTRAYLAEFSSLHGTPRRTRVIHNGRDPSLFKPSAKRRIVFAAGRLWDDAKNIGILCRVAEEIDIPVIAAGEFVAPDGSKSKVSGVTALGRISAQDTAKWMAEAAIFASPARYEPFGLSVLEAALSGCALVLGDIPTFRELWDGVATFVEPDDEQGLRRAINILAELPQLARNDGIRARERALSYSAELMGASYYQAYRDVNAGAAADVGGVAA